MNTHALAAGLVLAILALGLSACRTNGLQPVYAQDPGVPEPVILDVYGGALIGVHLGEVANQVEIEYKVEEGAPPENDEDYLVLRITPGESNFRIKKGDNTYLVLDAPDHYDFTVKGLSLSGSTPTVTHDGRPIAFTSKELAQAPAPPPDVLTVGAGTLPVNCEAPDLQRVHVVATGQARVVFLELEKKP